MYKSRWCQMGPIFWRVVHLNPIKLGRRTTFTRRLWSLQYYRVSFFSHQFWPKTFPIKSLFQIKTSLYSIASDLPTIPTCADVAQELPSMRMVVPTPDTSRRFNGLSAGMRSYQLAWENILNPSQAVQVSSAGSVFWCILHVFWPLEREWKGRFFPHARAIQEYYKRAGNVLSHAVS